MRAGSKLIWYVSLVRQVWLEDVVRVSFSCVLVLFKDNRRTDLLKQQTNNLPCMHVLDSAAGVGAVACPQPSQT